MLKNDNSFSWKNPSLRWTRLHRTKSTLSGGTKCHQQTNKNTSRSFKRSNAKSSLTTIRTKSSNRSMNSSTRKTLKTSGSRIVVVYSRYNVTGVLSRVVFAKIGKARISRAISLPVKEFKVSTTASEISVRCMGSKILLTMRVSSTSSPSKRTSSLLWITSTTRFLSAVRTWLVSQHKPQIQNNALLL